MLIDLAYRFPYIDWDDSQQRPCPRTWVGTHDLFGRADAEPLAEPQGLPDLHADTRQPELHHRALLSERRRLADLRLHGSRRAAGLLGVPRQFPFRPRLRGGHGDALGADRAQGQLSRPRAAMDAQPGLGAARPRRAQGIRHRAAVPGLAWTAAADRRVPGRAREGKLRAGPFGRARAGQARPDPHGVRGGLVREHDLFPKTGSHFSGSCSNAEIGWAAARLQPSWRET